MRGRQTLLTPDRKKRIVKAVREGNYFETACQSAGISPNTGLEWMARGEGKDKDRPPNDLYADFAKSVRLAEARAELDALKDVKKGFKGNPRLALEYMARRWSQRWGQRDQLTILKKLVSEVSGMSDEEVLALANEEQGEQA